MQKFVSFLRFVEFDGNLNIFHMMQDQWSKKGQDSDDEEGTELVFRADKIPPQSVANEKKVFDLLRQMCEVALAKYPNTLEQDYELLKDSSLSFNQRNCVLFRSGEKEILHFLIEFSEYAQQLLGMSFKDAKKTTQSLPDKFSTTREYLQTQLIPLLGHK